MLEEKIEAGEYLMTKGIISGKKQKKYLKNLKKAVKILSKHERHTCK